MNCNWLRLGPPFSLPPFCRLQALGSWWSPTTRLHHTCYLKTAAKQPKNTRLKPIIALIPIQFAFTTTFVQGISVKLQLNLGPYKTSSHLRIKLTLKESNGLDMQANPCLSPHYHYAVSSDRCNLASRVSSVQCTPGLRQKTCYLCPRHDTVHFKVHIPPGAQSQDPSLSRQRGIQEQEPPFIQIIPTPSSFLLRMSLLVQTNPRRQGQ